MQHNSLWPSLLQSDECNDVFDEQQEEDNTCYDYHQDTNKITTPQVSSGTVINSDEDTYNSYQERDAKIGVDEEQKKLCHDNFETLNLEKNDTANIFDAFINTDMDAFDED